MIIKKHFIKLEGKIYSAVNSSLERNFHKFYLA